MAKYKYITYRPERKQYQVKVRMAGKSIVKTAPTLNEALLIRGKLLKARGNKADELFYLTKNGALKHEEQGNLKESMTVWYNRQKAPFVEKGTRTRYEGVMRNYIFPYLGDMEPKAVTRDMIQTFSFAVNEKVTVASTRSVISLLNQYFNWIGGENPCTGVAYRREVKTRRKRLAFTKEQERAFLALVRSEDYDLYFLLNMYFETGCRRGELIACLWNQIDWYNGTLHIEPTLVDDGKGGVIRKPYPKNRSSIRDIPLTKKTLFILRSVYDQRKKYTYHIDDRYIFLTKEGKPVRPETLTAAFKRYRERAGLPEGLSLHSTRHTFASRLMRAGVPIHIICKVGGWESSKILLDVYTHVTQNEVRNALYKAFK
ncbi:tyrosine-type recombinase/integrase [Megasphaera elsdenii]|uniref:Site-specific integrase n=1 Tax=Megasphaera elsdenii TaxID=907 RepID=A0A848ES46_MEGEL|nr:site-specific integrase [Megasphaera elsdenii]NMK38235.1 site-specific integrase [Megasphaera elsdenii]